MKRENVSALRRGVVAESDQVAHLHMHALHECHAWFHRAAGQVDEEGDSSRRDAFGPRRHPGTGRDASCPCSKEGA